jgi:hypothetical protein
MEPVQKPSAYRIIEGCLYARHSLPYAHEIRVHTLGHGHTEATLLPRYGWSELGALAPQALNDLAMASGNIWLNGAWAPAPPPSQEELLHRAACNIERSARRAKTKVRRLCKARGLTTMLTLTYRENMNDRARMGRDFDVLVKRIRRVIPGFTYLCVFERQKRGAWHAHIAVPRILSHYLHRGMLVKSYDLLRSLWRAVVGVDNGNVDVSRSRRAGRSAAKLAAYMSKYITKGFGDGSPVGDSYRSSGRALPKPVVIQVNTDDPNIGIRSMLDLLSTDIISCGEFYSALLDCGGYFVNLSPK